MEINVNPQKKFNKLSTASKAVAPENSTPIKRTLMTKKVRAFCLAKSPIGWVKNFFIS